jgi:hypothetical protein
MTFAGSAAVVCGIKSSDIWEAARSLSLYGRSDVELEALISRHCSALLLVERVTAEAAQYVRDLRRAAAAGSAAA